MWIVFRLAGRHAGVQLPGPRGPGPRARGAHRGKLGQRRPAASDPGSLPRSRRGAVRLLHAGIRGGGRRPVGERREPKPGYRARGAQRQPLPVHGLPEDPRRGRPGGHTPASRRMILLDGCRVVVTMDDAGTELENGSILIDGGAISWVGQGRPPVREQPDVIDARGLVAVPGLINTHHHLYQTLTRVHAQQGGLFDWLPPDRVVEDIDTILSATDNAIQRFHDPAAGSMRRIAVGPCSPFSVSERLMRESAALARRHNVRLHTHIAETLDEEAYCQATFNRRPVELLDDLGFLGPDVWLAHCVHVNEADIRRLAETRTAVAWCPTSNMRLGSGFAPAREMIDAGVRVGLAVDGSASNDSGNLLAEARQAMLTTRGRKGPAAMTAREALRLATRGGAACLGRDDVGSIQAGQRADIALFTVDGLPHRGAEADPVAALVFCNPGAVQHLFVEGKPVVHDGQLVNLSEASMIWT